MTSRHFIYATTLAAALALSVESVPAAQQAGKPAAPAEGTAKPGAPPAAPPKQPLPTLDPAYVYEPAGRRDPFISLLGRGEDQRSTAVRPAGLSGLLIGEITVKGVVKDRNGFLAMLRAPDNKTYTARVGDKLFDGTVKSINQEKVIFSQDVNDPLSLVKQREVPKPVRQAEGRG
jgi:type IV pilus assembly protein PilP